MANTINAKDSTKLTHAPLVKVAAIQMASGPHVASNLNEAERLIALAVKQGAKLVVLPEYFAIMGLQEIDKVNAREKEGSGPIQNFLSKIAKKHKNLGHRLALFP